MDADILAERILLDLRNTFKKDPLIDEFDILPVSDSVCNKCPVIHVEHKVALESWCVQHVYLYAYSNFIKWRQHLRKIDSSVLTNLTSAILLINPDLETAWNSRKELVLCGKLSAKDELKFSAVVLSRKPKSPQVFSHRKWVLMWIVKNNSSFCTVKENIQHELALCTHTASKYSSNYYAWSHRTWIVQDLLHYCPKVIDEELCATEKWVSTHVSDHSGFHYRQFLISSRCSKHRKTESPIEWCLIHNASPSGSSHLFCFSDKPSDMPSDPADSNKQLSVLLTKELCFLSDLQFSFPGHETLWNHRRFIIHEFCSLRDGAKSFSSSSCTRCIHQTECIAACKKCKLESQFCSSEDFIPAVEEAFIQDCFHKARSNEWEKTLILRHTSWLKNIALCPVSLPHK